jgi:tetratricopeptide (TPR) repeat protein
VSTSPSRAVSDDPGATTWPLIFLGIWALEVGNHDEAADRNLEAIAVARESGDRKLVGIATNNLGNTAMQQGDFVRAASLFEESLEISRELGTLDEIPLETLNLASCLYHIGRLREAAKAAKESLALAHEGGSPATLSYGFVLLGALACRQGAEGGAARLLGVADLLMERVGETAADLAELLEPTRKELLAALGDEGYAKAFAEGRAMPVEDAVTFALATVD